MKRRDLIYLLSTVSLGFNFRKAEKPIQPDRGSFAIDANRVRFYNAGVRNRFSILMIADTHLFTDDARGDSYQQYSGRMAKAYNHTKNFQTGEPTFPAECFQQSLDIAKKEGVALVALIGDIMSFPSEAAVEWVSEQMKIAGLPYLYVAGNHDWHYEGMAGSLESLRNTWIHQRLLPLYQNDNPLMTVREINGIRLVAIDNSNYEILPEQLSFFQQQIASKMPVLLMLHIPLYAPGRPVSFGCGHPDWGAKSDGNYLLERRQRWPEKGHTATTLAFHKEVIHAPNLLGVLAGHTHRQSLDVINGLPQIVTNANATGAYLQVDFLPA